MFPGRQPDVSNRAPRGTVQGIVSDNSTSQVMDGRMLGVFEFVHLARPEARFSLSGSVSRITKRE